MTTTFETDSKGRKYIYKSPGAALAYTINLNDPLDPWLGVGETITTCIFTCPDTGITIPQQTNDTTTGTVKLSGGEEGTDYVITMTWTTSGNNTDSRFFIVKVRQRSAG
jgi:hypothetical protein